TVSGINNVTGSADTGDTISGNNQTYNLTALNVGNNVATSWTSFENVADTGSGTITASAATVTINGGNSGTHSRLSGGFSGIGNISDAGGGTFNIADGGSLSGNLGGGTGSALSYATRTGPVSFDLNGRANLSTGVTGTVTGINSVAGSGSTGDTITG